MLILVFPESFLETQQPSITHTHTHAAMKCPMMLNLLLSKTIPFDLALQ